MFWLLALWTLRDGKSKLEQPDLASSSLACKFNVLDFYFSVENFNFYLFAPKRINVKRH